jgi:hypothetical protein
MGHRPGFHEDALCRFLNNGHMVLLSPVRGLLWLERDGFAATDHGPARGMNHFYHVSAHFAGIDFKHFCYYPSLPHFMVRLQDVVLLMLPCNIIRQPVESLEGLFIRESLHHDRLKDFDFHMIEHLYNCLGSLTSPAV